MLKRIIYKKLNGQITNLRFEPDFYALKENEFEMRGNKLPPIESLYDDVVLLKKEKEKIKENIISKLNDLDNKSIRSLREWLANKEDAPQYIKDYELEAIEERKKLKDIKD